MSSDSPSALVLDPWSVLGPSSSLVLGRPWSLVVPGPWSLSAPSTKDKGRPRTKDGPGTRNQGPRTDPRSALPSTRLTPPQRSRGEAQRDAASQRIQSASATAAAARRRARLRENRLLALN